MNCHSHNNISRLLILLMLPLNGFAQEDYPISFDRNADRTRTDRVLNGIVLNGNVFQVRTPVKMYHALSDQTFSCHAGDLASPSLVFTGKWTDSCINKGVSDVVTPEREMWRLNDNIYNKVKR